MSLARRSLSPRFGLVGHVGGDVRIDLAPPVELLLEGAERAGIVAWLDRTLAKNGGGPLHIGFHLEPGYSVANCVAIHEELRRRGLTEARA